MERLAKGLGFAVIIAGVLVTTWLGAAFTLTVLSALTGDLFTKVASGVLGISLLFSGLSFYLLKDTHKALVEAQRGLSENRAFFHLHPSAARQFKEFKKEVSE